MLGKNHRNLVGGVERDGEGTFEKHSPIDGSLVGTFAKGTRLDVQDAIAAARKAFPAWSARPWQERVAILRRVADIISERQMLYAALVSIEVGKNRLEALGDVEETADLIRWSCDMVEQNGGFDHPMGNLGDESVHTRSVLKPYGVWAIISPFNFPIRAERRTVRRRPRGRQHGRVQAKLRCSPLRCAADPGDARRRRAGWRLQHGRGAGRDRWRRAPGERRRRRHPLHRILRGRLRSLQALRQALSQAGHRRDGRQEPGHRQQDRGS